MEHGLSALARAGECLLLRVKNCPRRIFSRQRFG